MVRYFIIPFSSYVLDTRDCLCCKSGRLDSHSHPNENGRTNTKGSARARPISQIDGRDEGVKEPNGINVNSNSYRNAQGGEANQIDLAVIQKSKDSTTKKKIDRPSLQISIPQQDQHAASIPNKVQNVKSEKVSIPLANISPTMRKSEREKQFYEDFVKKRDTGNNADAHPKESSPLPEKDKKELNEIKEENENEEKKSLENKSESVVIKSPQTEKRVPPEVVNMPQPQEHVASVPKSVADVVHSPVAVSNLEYYKIVRIMGKSEGFLYELEDLRDNSKAVLRMTRKTTYISEDKQEITDKINSKMYVSDLNHPNIVKFKDCWMDSTNFYFIQEYLEGKQLLDYIQDIHLTEKVVVEILKKLVSISMYLTNMGFQFTDLKPHCIFMCDDGKTMKVTDFDYKCTFDKESYSTNRYGSVYFVCPEVIDRMHNEDWLVWN